MDRRIDGLAKEYLELPMLPRGIVHKPRDRKGLLLDRYHTELQRLYCLTAGWLRSIREPRWMGGTGLQLLEDAQTEPARRCFYYTCFIES